MQYKIDKHTRHLHNSFTHTLRLYHNNFSNLKKKLHTIEATELTLKESEENYRLLFTNMLHGFALHEIIVDEKGHPYDYRYLAANPAFSQLTGLPLDSIVGRTVKELLPNIEPYWIENYCRVAITRESLSYTNYVNDIGKYFDTFVFSPKPGQFAVLFSDITEKKEQKEALEATMLKLELANSSLETKVLERTQDLEILNNKLLNKISELELTQQELIRSEKLASIGELVAGISHEINTPIGVSVTAASYLEAYTSDFRSRASCTTSVDYSKLMDKVSETSKIILSNLKRASNLVKSFKKVSVDRTSDIPRVFNVREYVDEITMSLIPHLKKTTHTIDNSCNSDIQLYSYPGAFSQVLTNLIMNSLLHAFMPQTNGKITIKAFQLKNGIRLFFSDNGIGMIEEIRAKIFDPFFTTKRNSGGTGLGLFIVHNIIINQLNGNIECISSPGNGTSFNIIIPNIEK